VTKPDGKPYGSNVNRPTVKADVWQNWWDKNKAKFNPGLRYRQGRACSPEVLLAVIESPSTPGAVRYWTAEELRIRYGYDWNFETEMLVKEQLVAISKARSWVKDTGIRFSPGTTFFAGRELTRNG
jgi:hypothetical protein